MKKALSPVIATVLLIGMSIALVGAILGIVKPFAQDQLDESQRCYDVLGKLEFNNEYTCYNETNETMVVSISQGDVHLDGILFIATDEDGTSSESFRLNNSVNDPFGIPGPESGKRYYFNNMTRKPSRIEIAPIVGGGACDIADSTYNIATCFA